MLTLACELLFILPTFDLVRCINRDKSPKSPYLVVLKKWLIAVYIAEFHRKMQNLYQHLLFIQGCQIKT